MNEDEETLQPRELCAVVAGVSVQFCFSRQDGPWAAWLMVCAGLLTMCLCGMILRDLLRELL